MKVLCVAEKPSIAKSVARMLSKDNYTTKPTKNKYIKNYEFQYQFMGQQCEIVMTSVSGHVIETDFSSEYRSWNVCRPDSLFEARILKTPREDCKAIVDNLRSQGKYAQVLFIWTDCDREGENIGAEVMDIIKQVNQRIQVKRAKFSVIQPKEIRDAWSRPVELDLRQVQAVDVRMEIDLRIGAAFTRLQTLCLQPRFQLLRDKILSYGPCQFPTLGFVVDRFNKVNSFVAEDFWSIQLSVKKDGQKAEFTWSRGSLFDKECCQALYDMLKDCSRAIVVEIKSKPTQKWKPLPLTTVELQKMGSTKLKISSDKMMHIAEKLYNEGFISYPRTETDVFDKNFDLRSLIQKQTVDNRWGQYANSLLNEGKFRFPRNGKHDDKAHPPIHPTREGQSLQGDEKRVYELVATRFLACCSENAIGHDTVVQLKIDQELFSANGLQILERNYLDVYPYDNWSNKSLPKFDLNEVITDYQLKMTNGTTTAPNLLTEADLITLMDKSGIGTDATIHEHIKKILEREYVEKERGMYFCPTVLGVALIEAYDDMDMSLSLSKPELRSQMESNMKLICEGRITKQIVLNEAIQKYKEAFLLASQKQDCFVEKFQARLGRRPEPREPTIEFGNCIKCNRPLVVKQIKDSSTVVGCSGYPDCKHSAFIPVDVNFQITSQKCSNCDCLMVQFIDEARVACVFCNQDSLGGPKRSLEQGPVCNCSNPSVKKKVKKEGANNGREFFSCANKTCDYFQWADLSTTNANSNALRTSNTLNSSSINSYQNQLDAQNQEEKRKCNCGLVAAAKTVSKEGATKGKQFYTCIKSSSKCNFFEWADQKPSSSKENSCFKCNQPGHYANACPNSEPVKSRSKPATRGRSKTKSKKYQ